MKISFVLVYSIIEPLCYFMDQIKQSAYTRGIDYLLVDCERLNTFSSAEFHSYSKRPATYMVTFNGAPVELADSQGNNIWRENNIPVIVFVNDNSRNYDSFLRDPKCDIHVMSLDTYRVH